MELQLRKYGLLFRELIFFSQDKGIRYLTELDVTTLRAFCEGWTQGGRTQQKKLDRLRAFLRFALESDWIATNPAKRIQGPKVTDKPTMPFSQDEMLRIYSACDKYPDCYGRTGEWTGHRLKALVLLMRYSGLRIGDAVRLPRDRIVDDKLFLYTQKTGVPVRVPLPEFVVTELNSVRSASQRYYFWSGTSDKDGVARNYMRYLAKLFHLAGIKNGHSHQLRDTFAVSLLLEGVRIERVSVLLGHSSVRITEKHYAPWVKERQEQLEADVRRTWSNDPVVFAGTKGTPEVHENEEVVN